MFQVESSKQSGRSNLYFSDYFPQSDDSYFLQTYNLGDTPFLKSLNALVLEEVLQLKPNQIQEAKIKEAMSEFFNELHWKINAQFNHAGEPYKGISLFFLIKRSNRVSFVQFGRLACGIFRHNNSEEIGLSWANYPIATVESLNQIGSVQEDIPIKVYNETLVPGDSIFTFPSSQIPTIEDVIPAGANSVLTALLNLPEDENNFLYLSNLRAGIIKPIKFFRGHSFRISAIFMVLIIIFSILYYFLADNKVEEMSKRTKESLSGYNFLFEVMNLTDNINNPELEKQLKKFVYSPAKDINLSPIWQGQFSHDITYPPIFDYSNIYLIVDENIAALDKRSKDVNWKLSFNSPVLRAFSIENNILLLLKNRHLLFVSHKGDILWEKVSKSTHVLPQEPFALPKQLTRRDDKRLNSGIIIVPEGSYLKVISIITGETVSSIQFEDEINYLSDYDPVDNCFYGVVNDILVIFKLQIKVW